MTLLIALGNINASGDLLNKYYKRFKTSREINTATEVESDF